METTRDTDLSQPTESELLKHSFGAVLTRLRNEAGFKQRMFSRVVGISNSHLRSIEQGKVSPTLTTIYKLAVTLEADPSLMVAEAVTHMHQAPQVALEYHSDPADEDFLDA